MFNGDELGNFVEKVGTHSLLDNSRLLLKDLLSFLLCHPDNVDFGSLDNACCDVPRPDLPTLDGDSSRTDH